MARHRITTASLLRQISDRRAAEASDRWRELRHDYMRPDQARAEKGERPRGDHEKGTGTRPASVS